MDIASVRNIMLHQPVQRNAARANKDNFAAQVQNTSGGSTSKGFVQTLSPYVQLRADYREWKEQQEPQVLPGSQGRTEENMSYLAQRYSGSLTMFQKMEALDTMSEMGILTLDQWNAFYGAKPINFAAGTTTFRSGPLDESFGSKMAQDEIELYRLSPLAKSNTLEDLFSWADNLS